MHLRSAGAKRRPLCWSSNHLWLTGRIVHIILMMKDIISNKTHVNSINLFLINSTPYIWLKSWEYNWLSVISLVGCHSSDSSVWYGSSFSDSDPLQLVGLLIVFLVLFPCTILFDAGESSPSSSSSLLLFLLGFGFLFLLPTNQFVGMSEDLSIVKQSIVQYITI